jgi:hypothetical protein
MSRTIRLKGDPLQKEALATAVAITPGYLVERVSGASTIQAHSTAGGKAQKNFAIEDAGQGKQISDAYAVSVQIQFIACRAGDEVDAVLQDGEIIVIGDWLESNGDGTLRKLIEVDFSASASSNLQGENVIGQALEAKSPSGADVNIQIEVAS